MADYILRIYDSVERPRHGGGGVSRVTQCRDKSPRFEARDDRSAVAQARSQFAADLATCHFAMLSTAHGGEVEGGLLVSPPEAEHRDREDWAEKP